MPIARFSLGAQTATGDFGGVPLIPGVEPGGQRGGRDKPALLIQDISYEILDMAHDATVDFDVARIFLKLSQETDLTPGLLLPIGEIGLWNNAATADNVVAMYRHTEKMHIGTIWAPRMVGVRLDLTAGFSSLNLTVNLSYERIRIPWTDWFVRWDFLDNIEDNRADY